jgi:hypothetical protein
MSLSLIREATEEEILQFLLKSNSPKEPNIGHRGEQGDKGEQGDRGLDGNHGADGKDGKDGIGRDGARGVDGIDGRDGVDGVSGERGEIGLRGPIGPKGNDGKDGKDGKDGSKGERGEIGPMPKHQIQRVSGGYKVRFEQGERGKWGEWQHVASSTIVRNITSEPSGPGGGDIAYSFETVSKNLEDWGIALAYASGKLQTETYTSGANTIVKTFAYTGSRLTSVTLSGDLPSGIKTTKTFVYTGNELTSVGYT